MIITHLVLYRAAKLSVQVASIGARLTQVSNSLKNNTYVIMNQTQDKPQKSYKMVAVF